MWICCSSEVFNPLLAAVGLMHGGLTGSLLGEGVGLNCGCAVEVEIFNTLPAAVGLMHGGLTGSLLGEGVGLNRGCAVEVEFFNPLPAAMGLMHIGLTGSLLGEGVGLKCRGILSWSSLCCLELVRLHRRSVRSHVDLLFK